MCGIHMLATSFKELIKMNTRNGNDAYVCCNLLSKGVMAQCIALHFLFDMLINKYIFVHFNDVICSSS